MILFIVTLALIINGVLSHIVAGTAKEKKIGYSTTFWVSFLLSPLFGLLLSIASPVDTTPKVEVKEEEEQEPCEYVEKEEDKGAELIYKVFMAAFVVVSLFMIYSIF